MMNRVGWLVGGLAGVVSGGRPRPVNHHLKLLKTILPEIMSLMQMLLVDNGHYRYAGHISGFRGKTGNVGGWQIASLV